MAVRPSAVTQSDFPPLSLGFTRQAWDDYRHWTKSDASVAAELTRLIYECLWDPFQGTGSPQRLKLLRECWSRSISNEHRLIYKISNKKCTILMCGNPPQRALPAKHSNEDSARPTHGGLRFLRNKRNHPKPKTKNKELAQPSEIPYIFVKSFSRYWRICVFLMIVLLVPLGTCVAILWTAGNDHVIVEPIEVPKTMMDRGYSPTILAQHMIANVTDLREGALASANTHHSGSSENPFSPPPARLTPDWSRLDFVVPSVGISFKSAVAELRRVFNRPTPTVVSGEFVFSNQPDSLSLHLRVGAKEILSSSEAGTQASISLESVDTLLKRGAHALIREAEPFTLVWHHYSRDEYDAAEELLWHILRSHPIPMTQAIAFYIQGIMYTDKGDFDLALERYELASRLQPDRPLADFQSGVTLMKKGAFDEAIVRFRQALQRDPGYAPANVHWGILLRERGEDDAAIAKFVEALEHDPQSALAYLHWGTTLSELSQHGAAAAKFSEALINDPTLAIVYVQWGVDEGRQGDYNAAIIKYKHAIRIDEKLTSAYIQWAIALRETEEYDLAIMKLEEVLEEHGDSAWIYFQLGETQRARRAYDAATIQYKKATSIDPRMTVAYLSWCSALIDKPDEKAVAEFVIAAKRYQRVATAGSDEELSPCMSALDKLRT